jgi:iron complex outermembrane receptor protein
VHVQGLEAEVEQRLDGGARVRAVYGWQKLRDATAAAALTHAPEHLLKLQWSDSLRSPAGLGWQSGRYAVEAIGVGPRRTLQNARLPAHIRTSLTYSARIADVDVSVGVYNLFNRRHADPASFEIREDSIAQDGRTFRVKLTYAF